MPSQKLKIAVVGTGISGLSAAWLLSQRHNVDIFERGTHVGGHANTVDVMVAGRRAAVDTGFIVYNEVNYPNLVELFRFLDVPTDESEMSFSVSLRGGRLEYSSDAPSGLFGQPSNILRPRFWSMLQDVRRFYGAARIDLEAGRLAGRTLGDYLQAGGYREPFVQDHLLPMGAAIWSTRPEDMRAYPAEAFVRFFVSHELLDLGGRQAWRTVRGGSRAYVEKLTAEFTGQIRCRNPIRHIARTGHDVEIEDMSGARHRYDHVVVATHADDALRLLRDPSGQERDLLGRFPYTRNKAFLHTDKSQMPRRRSVWASWNYRTGTGAADNETGPNLPEVSYWMNRLQRLNCPENIFVTLNPASTPRTTDTLARFEYDHPLFNSDALAAQPELWSLQGERNTWFCGSYFGYGFHEDALQSGLAVGEALGGVSRPWRIDNKSSRIHTSTKPDLNIDEPELVIAAE
tara:strand:+ start:113495 stop:114871 length:1377 start_codon:yes stop_codon:yes gene_type:complete